MGTLTLPASGLVYVDTQIVIYAVEKHPVYYPVLVPLWQAVGQGTLTLGTSELTVHECLVGPLKRGDQQLEADYETFFTRRGVVTFAVSLGILREAARYRASLGLRAPDAIQLATAVGHGCALLVHNDRKLRGGGSGVIADVFLDDLVSGFSSPSGP